MTSIGNEKTEVVNAYLIKNSKGEVERKEDLKEREREKKMGVGVGRGPGHSHKQSEGLVEFYGCIE